MLIELTVSHLCTHLLFFLPTPITVYRLPGKRDQASPDQVTATDLLSLLVGEGAISSLAQTVAKNVLYRMVRGPKKTIVAAAARLVDAFRASAVSSHCPHAIGSLLFWQYIS